jgi:hypothetical protein
MWITTTTSSNCAPTDCTTTDCPHTTIHTGMFAFGLS